MNFVPVIPQDLRKTASPTFANIKDSGLTSGRMTYAGTDGLLQDSANLTFDGTNLTCLGDITGDNLNVSAWNLKADYAFGANSFTGSGDFSGGEILGTSLESEGGLIVAGAALISSTLGVTGAATFASTVRKTTADMRRYYHLALSAFNPGASGATWTDPTASTLGGWKLNSVGEILYAKVDMHADWDGASDIDLEIYFECNVDNTGGLVTDTVDISVTFYYKTTVGGELVNRTQTVEVATVVGQADQGQLFKVEIPMNWDEASNVVTNVDQVTAAFHLETDTSEVDDIIMTGASFYYHTTHIGIESGDT